MEQALSAAQQQILPLSRQLQHVLQQSAASFDMLLALCDCPCCRLAEQQQQHDYQQQLCAAPLYAGIQQLGLVKQALESIQQYVSSLKPAWEILDYDMHQLMYYLHATQAHDTKLLHSGPPTDIDQLDSLLAAMQLNNQQGCPAVAVLQQHLAAFKQLVAAVQQQQQLVVHLLRSMPPCACGHIHNMPDRVDQLQAALVGMRL